MLNLNKKSTFFVATIVAMLCLNPVVSTANQSFISRHKGKIACSVASISTLCYLLYKYAKQDAKKDKEFRVSKHIKKGGLVGSGVGLLTYLLLSAANAQGNTKSFVPQETLEGIMKYAVENAQVMTVPTRTASSMLNFSILLPSLRYNLLDNKSGPLSEGDLATLNGKILKIIAHSMQNNLIADRSTGALVGNALGDAIGAPLEFLPANHVLAGRPHLQNVLNRGQLSYMGGVCNRFDLKPGQWTDDFSMALCLADSLIIHPQGYNGSDCRVRYCNWWHLGYNNAFRFDTRRPNKHSVGLGGNIAASIDDIIARHSGRNATAVSPLYNSVGEDAGNGSIMRNSPVALRFLSNMQAAIDAAIKQSLGTHPGADAAVCSAFMTYFTIKAIHRDAAKRETPRAFLDATITSFLNEFPSLANTIDSSIIDRSKLNNSFIKLSHVLRSAPPSRTEAMWDWKQPILPIEETLHHRGARYNGYPVNAGYLGSYCMDGIAMALWSFSRSASFEQAILHCVNLLGDADSTGAICGQLAGAFYGYNCMQHEVLTKVAITSMLQWDPFHEIILRALMLCLLGTRNVS